MLQGPIDCAVKTVREDGALGLWAGAAPTVLRNGTNQMCLFWAKNHMDGLLWGKTEGDGMQLSPLQSMASGFSAAFLGPIATGPFDVVKVRLARWRPASGHGGALPLDPSMRTLARAAPRNRLHLRWF